MKRKFSLVIFLLTVLISTTVFAATDVKLEIVEDIVCTVPISDNSTLEKQIISADIEKNSITMQMDLTNNESDIIPTGELVLVIDSSSSMNTEVDSATGETRKDLVLNSANSLVESLLSLNSTTLEIGVVSFSSSSTASEWGSENDSQLVSDFTNNLDDLKSKISSIEGTGNLTNLDAGLQLGNSLFTESDSNKYLIVLTDGVPNINIGNSDLVSVDALTTVIETTKQDLLSLENVNVISVLTGIANEQAIVRTDGTNSYTYAQVIEGIFGTEEAPTIGKFYNIQDTEIETTIKESIYKDLVPVSKTLTNIKVVDYFPQEIVDNFEFAYVEGTNLDSVSTSIDTQTNSITWTIDELQSGETISLKYTLTLKDTFDETIIDQVLNTNEKVDVTYTDPEFPNEEQTKTSDTSPKIKVSEVPKEDDTVSPEPLPETGAPVIIGIISLIAIATIFFAKRIKYLNF